MELYQEAYEANQKAMKEKGLTPISNGSHEGIEWEVFKREYDIYGEEFTYLGSLSSPNMWGYDLSSEFNPKFKAWFLERIKAYGVALGWTQKDISDLCYRKKQPFGLQSSAEQMTFPFKE